GDDGGDRVLEGLAVDGRDADLQSARLHADAARVDEVVVVFTLHLHVRAALLVLELRDRDPVVAELDGGPVLRAAVLEVVLDVALHVAGDRLVRDAHTPVDLVRDLLERGRAEIEMVLLASGAAVDDAYRDGALRAAD